MFASGFRPEWMVKFLLFPHQTQVELAQLQLNLHLPGTGHTEEQEIRPILTGRSGSRRLLPFMQVACPVPSRLRAVCEPM